MNLIRNKSKNQMYSFILIPHVFKKIGYAGYAIFFVLSFSCTFFFTDYKILEKFFFSIMLFFMLMISVSKEEIEDEMTVQIRAYSYSSAFLVAVLIAIFQPLLVLLVAQFKEVGEVYYDFIKIRSLLWFMLLQQILVFERLRRKQNQE